MEMVRNRNVIIGMMVVFIVRNGEMWKQNKGNREAFALRNGAKYKPNKGNDVVFVVRNGAK